VEDMRDGAAGRRTWGGELEGVKAAVERGGDVAPILLKDLVTSGSEMSPQNEPKSYLARCPGRCQH